jgi:signal transduction histidine kinase
MWFPVRIAVYAGLVLAYGLLLSVAVRRRLGRGRVHRLLEDALLVAAGWSLALGLLDLLTSGSWWVYVWQRVAQLGLVILSLLTAAYADAFVRRRGRPRLRAMLVALFVIAALGLDLFARSLPNVPLPYLSLSLGPVEAATLLLVVAWAVGGGSAWFVSIRAMRGARGYKHRNRMRHLLVSLVPFLVGDLLILIGWVPGVYAGFAARLLGFAVITFTLSRYELVDLRYLWLSSIRAGLLLAISASLYLLALVAAVAVSGTLSDLPDLAVLGPLTVVALLLAAAVDVWLRPRLRRGFDRSVLGHTYDVQRALRRYSQQVSLILDLERLADTTLQWVTATMRVEHAAFLLLTPKGQTGVELQVLRTTGPSQPEAMIFEAQGRFLTHFRNIRRPLSQYDLDMLSWFQAMPALETEWLRALGVDLYVPVSSPSGPVALLALGAKEGGRAFSSQDLEVLMLLTGQTAAALENARLVADLTGVQRDLQQLNQELAETNHQLKRLDQTKADFVTIASHELRTPLSQIFGFSDVLASLEEEELGDSQLVQRFLSGIWRGARRLKSVVDAMIDMSLIETGSLQIHPEPALLGGVVDKAVSSVQEGAMRRNQSIEVESLADLPPAQVDSARLEQVLVSLLTNAIKFTPDGGRIRVTGRVEGTGPESGSIRLCVADEGIGIDLDQQALIFEKFYRPENPFEHSTDDVAFKGAGPGLGLSIARGIVEAHGGRIWAESPGRDEKSCPGSQFFISLPEAVGAQEELGDPATG